MTTLAFLTSLTEWWNALDTPGQIFAGIGIVAGAITILLLFLTILGLDQGGLTDALEVDLDATSDIHADGSLFSTRSITGFFLGFGGGGSVIYESTGSALIAGLGGSAIGIVLLYAVYLMGKSMMKLQSDGTVNFADAVGSTGTVYITIPPKRAAGGQAQVTFKNRHEVINVITDAETPIASGDAIRVKERLADNLFLVESL